MCRKISFSTEYISELLKLEKMLSTLDNVTVTKDVIESTRGFEDITTSQAFALVGRFPDFLEFIPQSSTEKELLVFTTIKYSAISQWLLKWHLNISVSVLSEPQKYSYPENVYHEFEDEALLEYQFFKLMESY